MKKRTVIVQTVFSAQTVRIYVRTAADAKTAYRFARTAENTALTVCLCAKTVTAVQTVWAIIAKTAINAKAVQPFVPNVIPATTVQSSVKTATAVNIA